MLAITRIPHPLYGHFLSRGEKEKRARWYGNLCVVQPNKRSLKRFLSRILFHCDLLLSIVTMVLLPNVAYADPSSPLLLSVPFQNITLNKNHTLSANYTFGSHPIIFCYENNLGSVGNVSWPYKGKTMNAPLSLSLITNSIYQGQFADSSGTITVTNNQPSSLIVSCLFAL